jgi:hypothetical protein
LTTYWTTSTSTNVNDLIAMNCHAGRLIDVQDIAASTGHQVHDAPPAPDHRSQASRPRPIPCAA